MINYRLNILFVVFAFLALNSCKKMEDTYKEFIQDGETVYISKPDSLKAFVGRERIQLSWLLISDPKVKSYKVYWNNRADSISGNITKTDNVDTVKVVINNLSEGTYNFEVLQYDSHGNSSIKASIVGRTYGPLYESTLYNRPTSQIKREGNDIILTFAPSDESMKDLEISYVDRSNVSKKIFLESKDNEIKMTNFPIGGRFTFKTMYAPDALFVDVFQSVPETFEEVVAEVQSDKSKFKHYPLPTDTYQPEFDSWKIQNLWDGITDQQDRFFYMHSNAPGLKLPNWFTIDLGAEKSLSRVRVNHLAHNHAWLFSSGAPKTYEIYGSNNPSADGSFTDWDLLGSFTSVKPADANEALALGLAGEFKTLTNNSKNYRFVRFRTLTTYGGVRNVMISELTFYEMGYSFRPITN